MWRTRTLRYECLERLNKPRRQDASTHTADTVELVFVKEAFLVEDEHGENLMLQRVLLQPEKHIEREQVQSRSIFKIKYEAGGKCCTLIVDRGCTQKLNLKFSPHLNAYQVYWLQKWA